MKQNFAVLILALIAIVGLIVFIESRKPKISQQPAQEVSVADKPDKAQLYEPAKEISTPDAFLNTEPLTIGQFIGQKVILVDFWTYSCINCQRTLPYLNQWHRKYAPEGLLILGIHTPEFEFEKDLDNVRRAVEKFGVQYPVILDNDYSTWRAYRNRYWPHKYLIDADGYIVYDHIGEGAYRETEEKIVELLSELHRRPVALKEGEASTGSAVDFSRVQSPEMYLGSARLQFLNNQPAESCLAQACDYSPPAALPLNQFALAGRWRLEPERAILESPQGKILLRFSAGKVNLVAGAAGKNIPAEIYLDGVKVGTDSAGADSPGGQTTFSAHQLYNLIDLQGEYGERLLEIQLKAPGFEGFAFTFG